MLYDAYQAQQDLLAPFRAGADLLSTVLNQGWQRPGTYWTRGLVAAAAFLLHALVVWLAPLLAAGLALILLESVRRRARRG